MTRAAEMYEKLKSELSEDLFVHFPYFRSVANGNILEIGVKYGESTRAFVLGLEENDPGGHVWSVDIDLSCSGIFNHEWNPFWTFIGANSEDKVSVLSHIPDGTRFDVLFIDGDHSFEGCYADLVNYVPLVKPGGLVLVHDIRPNDGYSFPGVRTAFEKFEKNTRWVSEVRLNSNGLGVLYVPSGIE
jgi:predicted O-methyltransferase YrrM